jgi:hypothetical protein
MLQSFQYCYLWYFPPKKLQNVGQYFGVKLKNLHPFALNYMRKCMKFGLVKVFDKQVFAFIQHHAYIDNSL